ncbi:MAG: hypothetical protein MUC65_01460 [Pontiellaceae bacterium]|jgi:hypothetical protein|nr:hypothetical protein [Pontiellaceae bacterium]
MKKAFLSELICLWIVNAVSASVIPTNWIDRTDGVGATVTSQYTNESASYLPGKLFDNKVSSKYMTSNSSGWVQYQFGGGNKYTISQYTITSAADAPMGWSSNFVKNGSFELSMANPAIPTNWIVGVNSTRSTNNAQEGIASLMLTNNPGSNSQTVPIQAYKDYELSVWVNAGGMTSGGIRFDTNDKFDDLTQTPGGTCQFNINLGNATNWTQYTGKFNSSNVTTVTLRTYKSASSMTGTVYFDNVSLKARVPLGAAADMDPQSWTLSGSNDGTNWHVVDSRSGVDFTNRAQKLTFDVTTPAAYEYYRLSAANHGGAFLQWAEMELLGPANENESPYDYMWTTVVSGDPETAYGEDLDGDGRGNLYEYALQGDPENELDNGVAPIFVKQGNHFTYNHLQRKDDPALTYHVQTCTNLMSGVWTNTGFSVLSTNPVNEQYDEVSYNIPITTAPFYLRLNLSIPPMSLARNILMDTRLDEVVNRGEALLATGLNAGSVYNEVWIRDLSTFIVPLLNMDVEQYQPVHDALITFFYFQEEDGNIPDGYVPLANRLPSYTYRYSDIMTNVAAHKNTVETDQESCMIQAVCRYIRKTGDTNILNETVVGKTVRERLEMAMDYPLTDRFSTNYNLIWGATTADWGDVQPEDTTGTVYNANSHPAIDIYDNALFMTAVKDYLQICCVGNPTLTAKWETLHTNLFTAVREHLWDEAAQKFIPHIYLEKGSPFTNTFNESVIFYHGGTAVAIEADLLSLDEIGVSLQKMKQNVAAAGAATIGLTIYPAYPTNYFKKASMATPWRYQNGGDWTWFGARMVRQLARNGYVAKAYEELAPMLDRVLENNGFYEWYTPGNVPSGSGQFRGEAGVLIEAINELRAWAVSNSVPSF